VVLPCADGPFRAVRAVILGGDILELDDGLGRAEESCEFRRGLIIHLDMSYGTRVRQEEGTGRAKSMYIRGRGARLEGNEMNIIAVKQDKNTLKTVVRWDGKTTGEVGRSPFTAGDGARSKGELVRDGRDAAVTGPRQDSGILRREDPIPLRRVSRWPKKVERERGG
jgi:hypothetical protein